MWRSNFGRLKEITTIIVALKSRKSFITSQATFPQSIILTEKHLKKKKKEENFFYNIKWPYCHNKNKNKQPWGEKNPVKQCLSIILLVVFTQKLTCRIQRTVLENSKPLDFNNKNFKIILQSLKIKG